MKKLNVRDEARCGMVVPEGALFRGGASATVKQESVEQFNLHTVVSLPQGTFASYSDVKAVLLFFEWSGPMREMWYYELPLPEDLKKFSKGSPIQDEYFAEARELWAAWDAYRQGRGTARCASTACSWVVSVDEIKERGYDLTARNPNREETETYRHQPRSPPRCWRRSGRFWAVSRGCTR
jgi:type I restriction enzyme M protein